MMDNRKTYSNLACIYQYLSHRNMTMMIKRQTKFVIFSGVLIVLLNVLPYTLKAQVPDPLGDVDAPIDGGVSLLVVAGIGYGIKKHRDSRKDRSMDIKNNDPSDILQ
jgi:hypothetical protein